MVHLADSGKAVEDCPPPVGKDSNDTLVQYMQEYRAHCISMDDILEETR
jgi:hypothetical protein